jgi:hypothetical protein
MTTHDPSIGMTYGWEWRIRWFRSRHGLGRLWPRPAGPGAPVRLPYRRKLAAVEHALLLDRPGLSTRFDLFNHLTRGERPIGVEQLPGPAWPRPRRAHLAVLLALAAIVTLCLTLGAQARTAIRPCSATAGGGATVSGPVRGLSCPAYANTSNQ